MIIQKVKTWLDYESILKGNMPNNHKEKSQQGKVMAKESKKAQGKVKKVMHEFKERKLHSGSKKGPVVKDQKQAVAIAMSEARKKDMKVPAKKK